MKNLLTFLLLFSGLSLRAQWSGQYPNDVTTNPPRTYIIEHLTIITEPGKVLTDATLVVADGVIQSIGKSAPVKEKKGKGKEKGKTKVKPKSPVLKADGLHIDGTGLYCYASFIDLFSYFGQPETKRQHGGPGQFNASKPGAIYLNEAIHPESDASLTFQPGPGESLPWRAKGFGLLLSHLPDGLMRGSNVLTVPGNAVASGLIKHLRVGQSYSFDKGSSSQPYPTSLMGCIAVIRQTLYDRQWYGQTKPNPLKPEISSLSVLNDDKKKPVFFDAGSSLNGLRAAAIAKEFNETWIIRGGGDEYQHLDTWKKSPMPLVLPLTFPKPFKTDTTNWDAIPLTAYLHWEMAPMNPYLCWKAGLSFTLSSQGLDAPAFWKNLRAVWQSGLPSKEILAALTTTPAQWMGLEKQYGKIAPGMSAQFILCTDTLFGPGFSIRENWVNGQPIMTPGVKERQHENGLFVSEVMGMKTWFAIRSNAESKVMVCRDTVWLAADPSGKSGEYLFQVNRSGKWFSFTARQDSSGLWKIYPADGDASWPMTWIKDLTPDDNYPEIIVRSQAPNKIEIPHPFNAYGWMEMPKSTDVIITHVNAFIGDSMELQEDVDIYVGANGKIKGIGKNLKTEFPKVTHFMDAKGKYLTPGIIDEHSHIAVSGDVNEGTQSVTSEVRIGDVVNPTDINIYRQLSGGVTYSHLLHGSANAIGGQTQLIKLRWGSDAEGMKEKRWPVGFIKFALGENVKQSNWGDASVVRFPQTRMGVEAIMLDAFLRAKNYDLEWQLFLNSKGKGNMPRKDLELEALNEILHDTRRITCHSYVQSEINMLMHLGDSMGFQVNTFTHILEGYKVAPQMKRHHAAGSTFSDWWAYKYEVMEAIPYNAVLMTQYGVLTGINSDDAEMGRRLNQEAGKSIKYGNMNPSDALKMVTINPAKMLHIDAFTGSLRVGKDADLVLWSSNPLSIYARVEKTWVEGVCYFDLSQQESMANWALSEKRRLSLLMRSKITSGEKDGEPQYYEEELKECE